MNTKAKLLMSFKIWLAIYPSLALVLYAFREPLSAMPLPMRTLAMTLVLVPFVVFLGMPLVNDILKRLASSKVNH